MYFVKHGGMGQTAALRVINKLKEHEQPDTRSNGHSSALSYIQRKLSHSHKAEILFEASSL